MKSKEVFYQTVAAIPAGSYTTYGELAKLCGVHVRQIMAWLKQMPKDSNLPWHRIINGQRRISDHPKKQQQHELLLLEGLVPDNKNKYSKEWLWPKY
jgi:methylated-DNA-protein-cysteine methyltransferase-like protein